MPPAVKSLRVRVAVRLAAIAMVSAGVAGCSTGSARFGDNPFNNTPVARGNTPAQDITGAIPPAGSAPIRGVERHSLGQQPTASSLPPPPVYRAASLPPQPTYQAPAPVRSQPATPSAQAPAPHLASKDGVHVVGAGDTLITVARRYGKSRSEVARANGLPIDAKVRLGQRLTIPGSGRGVNTASAGRTLGAPPAPLAVPTSARHAAANTKHEAAKHEVPKPATRTAALAPLSPAAPAKGHTTPAKAAIVPAAPASKKSAAEAKPAPKTAAAPPAQQKLAKAETGPVATARLATPANDAKTEAAEAAPSSTGSIPGFRWPVRGRVIAGFGPKSNGQQNDGINLAVPEGTSVKAAEDGVVAYSGNELKGYGNLVLVRHSNGYVTAYAHASQLMVKRGDTIKRGQIIAKAGQTGSVSSPQLHFEIRKGSTPVEPTQFLSGG